MCGTVGYKRNGTPPDVNWLQDPLAIENINVDVIDIQDVIDEPNMTSGTDEYELQSHLKRYYLSSFDSR